MPDQPTSAEGGRWAPFPVQSWSRLPADEWGAESRTSSAAEWDMADPNEVPPEPGSNLQWAGPRRQLVPALVVGLCLALVVGLIVLADHGAVVRAELSAVSGFAPPDGAVAYVERRTETATGTNVATVDVVESARYTFEQVVLAIDPERVVDVTASLGPDRPEDAVVWRTTTTRVGSQGAQRTEVFRIDDGIALLASFGARTTSGPVTAETYVPALTVLPAEVRAGSRWSGSGRVGDREYRSEFRAAAAPAGCLQVDGTIAYPGSGATGEQWRQTWCPRRGLTRSVVTGSGAVVTAVASPVDRLSGAARLAPPVTTPTQRSWDPRTWKEQRLRIVSTASDFSERAPTDSAAQGLATTTDSGLLFRALAGGGDLVAVTPKSQDAWQTLWRMHPGGRILSLTAFGNVVVVTTSQRTVVAYDDSGERLWTYAGDELVPRAPVRVDDASIAAVTLAGRVSALTLADGVPLWSAEIGVDVDAALATAGVGATQVVIAFDRDGGSTALAANGGAVRWRLAGTAPTAAIALGPDTVLVADGTDLDAVDVALGARLWRRPLRSGVTAMAVLGAPGSDSVLVATRTQSAVVDVSGLLTARPGYRTLTTEDETGGDWVVGWTATGADAIDANGAVRRSLRTDPVTLATSRTPVAQRDGVLVFAADWSFEALA